VKTAFVTLSEDRAINCQYNAAQDQREQKSKFKIYQVFAHYPSQAQPFPLWQVRLRAMQLSPQALPFLQTLQQAKPFT